MKTKSPLMTIVQSHKALAKAWQVIQENASTSPSSDIKKEVQDFALNATGNIIGISTQLAKRTFAFGKAKGIPIAKQNADGSKSKTKFRPIVLASLKARIVQRAVLDALGTVPDLKPFSENAFSFGGIRKRSDDLAAVPAAVHAVIKAAENGARYVMFADIRAFFTRIPKPLVTKIVADAVRDPDFTALFTQAIHVELENMAELKEKSELFPIEEIGVAQGNSLSPLLGNILLHDFDRRMNEGDCVCIRYIDDFIILAPNEDAARSRMRRARRILKELGMELSAEKSSRDPVPIQQRFEWLGIEFHDGAIRPAPKALTKLEENVKKRFADSCHGMRTTKPGKPIPRKHSLVATLNRVDGIIRGWGKHYRFCNDDALFGAVDQRMQILIRGFIGEYTKIKAKRDAKDAASLLGVEELLRQERKPLKWQTASAATGA